MEFSQKKKPMMSFFPMIHVNVDPTEKQWRLSRDIFRIGTPPILSHPILSYSYNLIRPIYPRAHKLSTPSHPTNPTLSADLSFSLLPHMYTLSPSPPSSLSVTALPSSVNKRPHPPLTRLSTIDSPPGRGDVRWPVFGYKI